MEGQEVVEEFQRRRKQYLRKSLPAFLMIIVGFAGCYFQAGERVLADVTTKEFLLSLIPFGIAGGGIVWWTLLTFKIYRCPVCNEVPIGGWLHGGSAGIGFSKGVEMNPDVCPKCGVQLK